MCRSKTYNEWKALFSSSALRLKPLFPHGTYTFPWEKDYLSFPPLVDIKTLPSLALSTVTIVGEKQGWVACDVGQRLTGRLDVKDGYGRQRQDGLDEVRVWMMDDQNTRRRAAGQVKDFRNGSYGLEITCLWRGSISKLRVAVVYPREFVRAAIHQKIIGATRYTLGKFKDGQGVEEVTVCHPSPNLPGRPCICNFTSFNTREYYCGQPLDARLNCSHWTATTSLPIPPPYHVTTAEEKLIFETRGSVHDRLLETEVFIKTSNSGHLPKIPECTDTPRNTTWGLTTRPQGFWNELGTWIPLQCKGSNLIERAFLKCLKNSQVYILGDSNAKELYISFVHLVGGNTKRYQRGPRAEETIDPLWNFTMKYFHHDYPLFLGRQWMSILRHGSIEQIIDRIPPTGRQLVILHYYLHMTPFHMTVGKSRLDAAANAITRLLKRNPEARVAFRGPHVASKDWGINPLVGGDVLGKQYLDIISKAFSNLKDKVILLDGWEMTLAMESSDFHPNSIVPQEMIRKFISFMCK